jgi:hypothetical protein
MVLAELEGLETVENEGLGWGRGGAEDAVLEEQTVAAEAVDVEGDGGGRDPELAGELAVGRAAEDGQEEAGHQIGAP